MGTVIIICQLILSLSILVILHECGHFFPAKWFKTKVEKFYLFFDPYFSLFKKKIGETEYGIGWLPLGGYVKIAGMVDESMDIEQMKKDPQPWEFRSKPAWQRLIIMLGGITVNFILGFFIFSMLIWKNGIPYLPTSEVKYGIATDSISQLMGFRDGDVIIGIQGEKLERFDKGKIIKSLILENKNTINVIRNGVETNVVVAPEHIALLTKRENKDLTLIAPRQPLLIDTLPTNMPAFIGGLMKGDRIFMANDQPINFAHELHRITQREANKEVKFGIIRGVDTLYKTITSNEKGVFGIDWPKLNFSIEEYSFFQSFPMGVKKGIDFLTTQLKAFGKMFTGEIKANDSLGGFISIAGLFDNTWNWNAFWNTTAVLSIILAFMNLLPIPGLDGGYVVFLLWEVISGKKVSDKFMEKAVTVGFFLLMALMIYANGLDLIRAFFN
ncbi:MAG: RIP metalloprotease RseP [Saprospiraceae bacterium]|nr:RIP metalloprotease RseP [Saprospiraceae bacterium]